jgi:hypothetical protein
MDRETQKKRKKHAKNQQAPVETFGTPERNRHTRETAASLFKANPQEFINKNLEGTLKSLKGNEQIIGFYSDFFQNFNEEEFKEKIGNDEAVKQSKIDLLEAVETQLDDGHKIELLKSLRESRYLDDLNLSEILNAINLDDKNLVLESILEDGLGGFSDEEKSNLLDIIQICFEEELSEKNEKALWAARRYIETPQLETQIKALKITIPYMGEAEKAQLCAFLLEGFADDKTTDEKLGIVKLVGLVSKSGFSVDAHFTAKDDVIALLLVDLTTQAFNKKLSPESQKSHDGIKDLISANSFDISQQTIFKSLQEKSLKEILEYFNGGLDKSFADQFKDFLKAVLNFFLKLAGREQYSYSASKECSTFAELIASKPASVEASVASVL